MAATSGGLDVATLGGIDWRREYRAEYPNAAAWIWQERVDYGEALGELDVPALLVWGDSDPISPVSLGQRLAQLLPTAALHVLSGGTHSLAHDHPDQVAALIIDHL